MNDRSCTLAHRLANKGIVLVTFNYRLGPLGFLATPELSKESEHNASGDYGLLDSIALLKWAREVMVLGQRILPGFRHKDPQGTNS